MDYCAHEGCERPFEYWADRGSLARDYEKIGDLKAAGRFKRSAAGVVSSRVPNYRTRASCACHYDVVVGCLSPFSASDRQTLPKFLPRYPNFPSATMKVLRSI